MSQNIKLESRLKRDGYSIIDFLNLEEIHDLRTIFDQYHLNNQSIEKYLIEQGMLFSNIYPDNDYKEKITKILCEYLSFKAEKILDNYELINSVFIIKTCGYGQFDYHQDWNMVDEIKHRAYNVWVPLQDVNQKNGTIKLIPGSHNFFPKLLRSPSTPWIDIDTDIRRKLDEKSKIINLKVGEAVIFDSAMIHATTRNVTQKNRISILFGIKPFKSRLLHYYYHSGSQKFECIEISKSYFYDSNYLRTLNCLKPDGKSLKFIPQEKKMLDKSNLLRKLNL